jgi:GNAT superfamily N-acetyltransferase
MNLSQFSTSVRTAATETYVEKKVDPALMTWKEFWELVNHGGKSHSSSAYDWSAEQMKGEREKYPTLLFRKVIKGVVFEFRQEVIDRYQEYQFTKTDADGNVVRINGEIQYFTPEELTKLGTRRYEYSFAVFDGEQQVATAQDEWGCLLVAVAREYRGFGLGPIVTKLAWEAEPGKTTGGCTPAGARVTKRAHDEFVREYLRKGIYSYLVQNQLLTLERVKEITKGLGVRPEEKVGVNLGSSNPEEWLLYEDYGAFILYDKKLKDVIDNVPEEQGNYWYERFIKGFSYAGGGYHDTGKFYLQQFGGDTPKIKKFMLLLALSYSKKEGVPLHVYDKDLGELDPSYVEIDGNLAILKGNPTNWEPFVAQERRFRQGFDRYGEFLSRIQELAHSKFE